MSNDVQQSAGWWRRALSAAISWSVACGTAALFVFAFVNGGPNVEAALYPAITDAVFSEQGSSDDDKLTLRVVATKQRECQPLGATVLTQDSLTGEWRGGTLEFTATNGVIFNRPMARQVFGPWHIRPDTKAVRISMQHRCHPLWVTVSRMSYP